MRQRLGFAQALMGAPDLILLDEPSNGLNLEGQYAITEQIQQLQDAGKTIILSSHHLPEVTRVCTDLLILKQGQIHYQNSIADALSVRPHTTLILDDDATHMTDLLKSVHLDIEVNQDRITLHDEAMNMRRQVLSILLSAGFDVLRIDRLRATLKEIYAEAIQ